MDGPRPSSFAAPSIWYDGGGRAPDEAVGEPDTLAFGRTAWLRRLGRDGCRHAFTASWLNG